MKKLLVIILAVFSVTAAAAQPKKYNPNPITKKMASSDVDINDPKKNTKANTWISRGDIYYEAETGPTFGISRGMTQDDLKIAVGETKEISKETIGSQAYDVWHYESMDVYFPEGVSRVMFWKQKVNLVENGFDTAFNAYLKALEVDPKAEDRVKERIQRIPPRFKQEGEVANLAANYAAAAENFEKAYLYSKPEIIGKVDTASAFNAGYLYVISENYEKGAKYLEEVKDMGFDNGGEIYKIMFFAYNGLKDFDNTNKILREGIEKYPEKSELLEYLVVLYSNEGKDADEIYPLIEKGMDDHPDNYTFPFSMGNSYLKSKEYDKAVEMYKKAAKIKPTDFGANYNLAVSLARSNDEKVEVLNNIPLSEEAKYQELLGEINGIYKSAIPYLEAAHKAKPDDYSTVELLKNFYFRFKDESPEMMKGFEKYDAVFKTMQ